MNRDIKVIFDDMERAMNTDFFEDDGFFRDNSMFNNDRMFATQGMSLFNSNERGNRDIEFGKFPTNTRSRLPECNSLTDMMTSKFPTMSENIVQNDITWDGQKWTKVIELSGEKTYSNINLNVQNNIATIGAAEEIVEEKDGKKSMSSSMFSNSFMLPQHTQHESVKAEIIGSTITISGEVEKKVESIEAEKEHEIPITFE